MKDREADRKKTVILEDLDRLELERESLRGNLSLLDLVRPKRTMEYALWRKLFSFARPYVTKIVLCLLLTMIAAAFMGVKLFLLNDGLEPLLDPKAVERRMAEERLARESQAALEAGLEKTWIDVHIVDPVEEAAQSLKETISAFLTEGNDALVTLVWIIVVFILVVTVEQLLKYFSSVMIRSAGHRIVMDIRNELFGKVMSFSLRFHNKNHSGRLISRITGDIAIFGGFFTNTATELVQNLIILLVCTAYLYMIGGCQVFLFALLVLVIFLPVQVIGRKLRAADRQIRRTTALIYAHLAEAFSGQKVIKAFTTERAEHEEFKHVGRITYRKTMKSARLRARTAPVVEVLGSAIIAGLVWFGGTAVIEHNKALDDVESRFTTEEKRPAVDGPLKERYDLYKAEIAEAKTVGWSFQYLVMVCFALYQLVRRTRVLAKCNNNINSALASADRIAAILYSDPEIDDSPGAVPLDRFTTGIDFRKVYYEYDPGAPVLQDVDLSVKKGSVVALVGPSGAGKTTFVDLIPRFYDVVRGSIRIDGRDIRDYTVTSLRSQIGIVSQETFLFSDTVGTNIAYSCTGASEEMIVAAAKAANAHEFIMELDGGYDSSIGERGVLLSGGQRQRIAIARALLKDPPILILDEATSALDSKSEALVQDALFRLMEGRTTFVIAHRLSTIRKADTILVFDETRLAETGTHDELIAAGGLYARLHELQTKWPEGRAGTAGVGGG